MARQYTALILYVCNFAAHESIKKAECGVRSEEYENCKSNMRGADKFE
jgi:hypothetical protein